MKAFAIGRVIDFKLCVLDKHLVWTYDLRRAGSWSYEEARSYSGKLRPSLMLDHAWVMLWTWPLAVLTDAVPEHNPESREGRCIESLERLSRAPVYTTTPAQG